MNIYRHIHFNSGQVGPDGISVNGEPLELVPDDNIA